MKEILEKGEKIIWKGKPNQSSFIISSFLPIFIFGMIWLIINNFISSGFEITDSIFDNNLDSNFNIVQFIVKFMPLIISVIVFFARTIESSNIEYAITDKRVLVKRGIIGTDYKVMDHSSIRDVTVKVGMIDKMNKTGTVIFDEKIVYGENGAYDSNMSFGRFSNIEDPYKVFKLLKEVVLDVKSDINYPNDYRPKENHGYKTKYKREK